MESIHLMSAASEFKLVFQVSSLEDIYFSSVKFKSSIGIDRVNTKAFEKDLNNHISVVRNKSLNGTYVFSQFRV